MVPDTVQYCTIAQRRTKDDQSNSSDKFVVRHGACCTVRCTIQNYSSMAGSTAYPDPQAYAYTHNRTAIYLISLRMDCELPNCEILYTVVRRFLRFIFPKGPSRPRRSKVQASNICRSSNTSRKLVPVACNLNLSVQSTGENVDGLQEMNHNETGEKWGALIFAISDRIWGKN